MKIIVLSRTGADSVSTELETDRNGTIEIPTELGETHGLYGDADGRSATFRLFRTIPESALGASRKVNAQHDLPNLSADELSIPEGNGISLAELDMTPVEVETVDASGETETIEPEPVDDEPLVLNLGDGSSLPMKDPEPKIDKPAASAAGKAKTKKSPK